MDYKKELYKIVKDFLLKKYKISKPSIEFIPTKKNSPAEAFLPNCGFKKENEYWIYDLNNPIKSPNHLLLEVE